MKIGLALGSGAARGWAHIGIIEALEELGIKIDVIAGCSIGSYVGAAYASGKLNQLKSWAVALTEWQVLSKLGVGFRKGGLVSGQKVFQALEELFSEATFEELPRPLGVVATDLYSGREVSFTSGSIVDAVRASCAIPGLFPPVSNNDRWLVDGAVVNPVPVNLCHQMGADFIIAVNLAADFRPQVSDKISQEHQKNQQRTDDFFGKSQALMQQWLKPVDKSNQPTPPSIIGVMSSAMEIMQARVTRSKLAGDPPDILIEPQLRHFGVMEFYRAQELIDEGRQVVDRMQEQILYQLKRS